MTRRFFLTLLACAAFTAVAPAQRITNVIPDVARPLPMDAVRLTGGPLRHAQDLNATYLLGLEPDRMLAFYHRRMRTFEILVDGQRIAGQTLDQSSEPRFFDVEYPLPPTLAGGTQKVTVRFQATNGNEIAGVFGVRVIRANARR